MRCLNGRNHKFICINVGQVKRIAKVLDPLLEKYPLCPSVSLSKRVEHVYCAVEQAAAHTAISAAGTKDVPFFETSTFRISPAQSYRSQNR